MTYYFLGNIHFFTDDERAVMPNELFQNGWTRISFLRRFGDSEDSHYLDKKGMWNEIPNAVLRTRVL
jgi:hypothetical protein